MSIFCGGPAVDEVGMARGSVNKNLKFPNDLKCKIFNKDVHFALNVRVVD